jgi:hypothetical protein
MGGRAKFTSLWRSEGHEFHASGALIEATGVEQVAK